MTKTLQLNLEVKTPDTRFDLALLELLRKENSDISRALLKSWFQDGLILLKGNPVKGSLILPLGIHSVTVLRKSLEVETQAQPSKQGSFLPIIYENEDLLVLNKASGVPSVPHQSSETETAVGSALARFPGLNQIGRGGFEPGLLHRLDTGTSGVLVFAKSQDEFERLRNAWQKRIVQKFYRALVTSSDSTLPINTPLKIEFPLAHDAKSSKKMVAIKSDSYKNIRGKPIPALTHILSTKELNRQTIDPLLFDFEIQIETGVMHQIRCHLSAIGYSILGDSIYKGQSSQRLWLHAWKLKIPLRNSEELLLEAPLPEDWPSSKSES